jgi:hypothetical protein
MDDHRSLSHLADHVWDRRELARMIIEHRCSAGTRRPYQCGNSLAGPNFSHVRGSGHDREVREDVACANFDSHWMPPEGRQGCFRTAALPLQNCGYRSVGKLAKP